MATPKQAIADALDDRLAASPGPEGTVRAAAQPSQPYMDLRGILDTIAKVLQDGQVTQGDFAAVADYAEELYDTHVAPFDIPGLGPVLEPYVDDLLRKAIRPTIKALFDNLAQPDQPAPGPQPNPILDS